MRKSGLIELLRTFSPKEIKEFDEFIRSPFFNKSESVIKLYEYLRKYYPEFPEDKIKKQYVYRKTFARTRYNDGFMRKVIFQLSKLGEDYILYLSNTKDIPQTRYNFLQELLNRNLSKTFRKRFKEMDRELENGEYKNLEYSYGRYLTEGLITSSLDKLRYKIDLYNKKALYNEHTIKGLKNFRNYFTSVSLNLYRYLNYESYNYDVEFNDEVLDNLINFLIEKYQDGHGVPEELNSPEIRLHVFEIMLMKTKSLHKSINEDKYFILLKKILTQEGSHYEHDTLYSLYNILYQHCICKIQRGYEDYIQQRFILDKHAVEQNIYKTEEETYFPPPVFVNFVRDAVEAGEINRAVSFIDDYRELSEPDNMKTVINLSFAHICFGKKEYEEALNYLNKIKPIKGWEFRFGVKEIMSKIFYELSRYEEAYYLIDSFKHFISTRGKHYSRERIVSRNNYIKYYLKLLKMKENGDSSLLDEVMADLSSHDKIIFNRSWLKEKAKELEGM